MTQPNFAVLAHRGAIRVSGPDSHHFLQNLITSDVEEIDKQGAGFGALLTPQGKILFDFLIYRDGDAYLLDAPLETLPDLAKRLTFYKLRAKVEIENLSEEPAVVAVWNSTLPENLPGISTPDPRLPALGFRLVGFEEEIKSAFEASGAVEKTEADYAAHRIGLAVPEAPFDFAYSEIFPHDADMDQLSGVSFSKGCYVGQEVVSRVHHRGTARKRFIAAVSNTPLPEPGTPVLADGKAIGTLGSSADIDGTHKGLALVRLDKAGPALKNGIPITCGDSSVTLSIPDWANFGWPDDSADAV